MEPFVRYHSYLWVGGGVQIPRFEPEQLAHSVIGLPVSEKGQQLSKRIYL